MKRTELKRKTPLQARTGLKTYAPLRATNGLQQKTPQNITRTITKPRKPLRQTRSTGKPTNAQAWRLVTIKKLGCICCMLNMQMWMPVPSRGACEAHHLLSGGLRRGHDFTIGLCAWHHRAVPIMQPPIGVTMGVHIYGPTVATGSKPFHAMYGTDDELLAFQNALLDAARAAR